MDEIDTCIRVSSHESGSVSCLGVIAIGASVSVCLHDNLLMCGNVVPFLFHCPGVGLSSPNHCKLTWIFAATTCTICY